MASLGESDLMSSSRTIGKTRALFIFADSAIYPRLGIQLGCTLYESTSTLSANEPPFVGYELRDLAGELRLAESGPVVGTIHWSDRHRRVRSSDHPYEQSLKLTCDLDHLRLERLDEPRGSKAPTLWLQLWPRLARDGHILESEVRAFSLGISQEQWLDFLSRTRTDQYELIEVRFNPANADAFKRALDHLRTARATLDAGDPRAAVGHCRLALDALLAEHPDLASGSPEARVNAL